MAAERTHKKRGIPPWHFFLGFFCFFQDQEDRIWFVWDGGMHQPEVCFDLTSKHELEAPAAAVNRHQSLRAARE